MKPYIIVDLDGTISDATHRLHLIQNRPKKWDEFFEKCIDDAPHKDVISLVNSLALFLDVMPIYVSGRSDVVRSQTLTWMARHGVYAGTLHMRKAGDCRPDDTVKEEILDKMSLTPDDVWFVLDDRDRVVKMWRRRGFRVLQVDDGSF
jgi:hypothetical protein